MSIDVRNLLTPPDGSGEAFHPIQRGASFSLEHIVSRGEASPPGFWYDQPRDEWVILLRGTATLEFGDATALDLTAGDSLLIPAHSRHRVAATSADAVWVALHFERAASSSRPS